MPTPTAQPENESSLTPDDIKKLTSELSAEIDEEIKKQLAEPHPFSDTQKKIDEAVRMAQEARKKQDEKKEAEQVKTPSPEQLSTPTPNPTPTPTTQNPVAVEVDGADAFVDPLSASINSALSGLKEGDKIGEEWVLKKIYSTSFGHNTSFFYELENTAGAKWTLNPEEMKDLLKKNVGGQKTPDLAPPPEPETKTNNKTIIHEKELFNRSEAKQTEKEETVNTAGKGEEKLEEKQKQESSETENLSNEQIELVKKLHADPKLWQSFSSLKPDQISKIQTLYEKGQLVQFGIDAHPLLDKFKANSLGKEMEIGKNDTFESIVEKSDLSFTYSNEDAVLMALHILANQKLLAESIKKAEAAGLVVTSMPEQKEIITLTKEALSGNNNSFAKISNLLKLLPANSKFRVLSQFEVSELKKYFAQ